MGNAYGPCTNPNCLNHGRPKARLLAFKSDEQWYRLLVIPPVDDDDFIDRVKQQLLSQLKNNSSDRIVGDEFTYDGTPVKIQLAKIELEEVSQYTTVNKLLSD